jgi:hypothetical protein
LCAAFAFSLTHLRRGCRPKPALSRRPLFISGHDVSRAETWDLKGRGFSRAKYWDRNTVLTNSSEVQQQDALPCSTLQGLPKLGTFGGRLVRELEAILAKFDQDVLRNAIHSFTLLSWCKYEPSSAPALDFLRNKRGVVNWEDIESAKERTAPPPEPKPNSEAAWNAMLDQYRFSHMDEFDLVLLGGVEKGYFDEAALTLLGARLEDQIKASRSDNSFSEAWDMLRDSFDDNQEQVLNAMYDSSLRALKRMSVTSLNSTGLLKTLGRPKQAAEIIDKFVETRGQDRATFDLQVFPFGNQVTDPDVINAFKAKLSDLPVKMDAKESLISIADTNSWNPDDLKMLAAIPVDEYHRLLKNTRGSELRKVIKASFMFDAVMGATPDMKELSMRVKEALQRIGKESPINALRVRPYGVIMESTVNTDMTSSTGHQP